MVTNKISLVVLNFNDYQTTRAFIDNIKNYKLIDSIVIVDNCSTDNSFDLLKNKYKNKKIKVVKTDKNGGYSYGNNFGIKTAIKLFNPSIFIIANPDVVFDEDVVLKMANVLDSYDKVGLVAPTMKLKDGKNGNAAWKLPKYKEDLLLSLGLTRFLCRKHLFYKPIDLEKKINYVDVVPGSLFMASIKTLQDINFFDEGTFLYCEEDILAFKLIEKGYKSILLGEEFYIHDHSTTISKSFNFTSKYKILHKSKRYYHKQYLRDNKLKMTIFEFVSMLSNIEKYLIQTIKLFR